MHAGKNYSFFEVLFWTRRDLMFLVIVSAIPTSCYVLLDWKWLAIPWLPIALIVTAVAFAVGFRNSASYDRAWKARKAWGMMINDYVTNQHATTKLSADELRTKKLKLTHRHFAWLTALCHQLREPRVWEAINKKYNQEYKDKWVKVKEHGTKVEHERAQFISAEEVALIMSKTNKAAQITTLQSAQLKELHERGLIDNFSHMEIEKMLVEFLNQQGASERIKNFPYPRQYSTINL